jgi:hypothetical protein
MEQINNSHRLGNSNYVMGTLSVHAYPAEERDIVRARR